jgi:hypothetical protein
MAVELIAPCGMNCALCSGYLAWRNGVKERGIRMPYCKGCRPREKVCAFLKRECRFLLDCKVEYCFQCGEYPCRRLLRIDARYRSRYSMSMIENLESIKKSGVSEFLRGEELKWRCPECGGVICCHNGLCFGCGIEKLRVKKKLYRWED